MHTLLREDIDLRDNHRKILEREELPKIIKSILRVPKKGFKKGRPQTHNFSTDISAENFC